MTTVEKAYQLIEKLESKAELTDDERNMLALLKSLVAEYENRSASP